MPQTHTGNIEPYKKNFYYLAILLAGAAIAFWPIAFHVFSLKNDALNYFLPVRRLVSESFFHGYLPLWTPYMNLGYPLHGDMQSGVWNPIVQLFSIFGPYTLHTLQLETLLYVYISGAGMFFLLKYLRLHPWSNIAVSFAYMLCGFATDSAQFLNWIAALAFLPFVFLFYHKSLTEKTVHSGILAGFSLYLMFTTAYPADFIITLYLMAALLTIQIIGSIRQPNIGITIRSLVVPHLILLVIFLLLSAPAIISFIQTLPYTERGSGASYRQVMSNPLHPFLVSSYITPLAIWKMPGVSITDGLLRNSWFGIIPFVFFIAAYFTPATSTVVRFSKYAAVVFLLFSFGEMGGIRILAYYLLPMMDTFRHPANARMFTIFFSCILAAWTMHEYINSKISRRTITTAFVLTLVFIAGMMIWAISANFSFAGLTVPAHSSITGQVKFLLDRLGFAELLMINILLQFPFLYLFWKWTIRSQRSGLLVSASIANVLLFAMLLQPQTVVKNQRASSVQQLIDQNIQQGYPLPDLNSSLAFNSADGMNLFKEIGVLNLYNKKVGRVDYRISPSNLLLQNEFWLLDPNRKLIMQYPLLYRCDTAVYYARGRVDPINDSDKKYVFVSGQAKADSINNFEADPATIIQPIEFQPNIFRFRIRSAHAGYYVLLQNHFHLWKVNVGNETKTPDIVNTAFMGISVPAGDHTLQFTYDDSAVKTGWFVNLAMLTLLLVYSTYHYWQTKKKS